MNSTIHFVVGFLFNPTDEEVVLIEKIKPAWQAGKLNGVGGHVEEGEAALEAVEREFLEEAGLLIKNWEHFATIYAERAKIDLFRANSTKLNEIQSITDEKVSIYKLSDLFNGTVPMISNLLWTIIMAMPRSRHDWPYAIFEKS